MFDSVDRHIILPIKLYIARFRQFSRWWLDKIRLRIYDVIAVFLNLVTYYRAIVFNAWNCEPKRHACNNNCVLPKNVMACTYLLNNIVDFFTPEVNLT